MFYFQTTFLQALNSIDSFNITSGVVGVAETILLLSVLYSAYQAFATGGTCGRRQYRERSTSCWA